MLFSWRSVLRVLSLATAVSAASNQLFESIFEVPRGWEYDHAASAHESVMLRLSLKQQNIDLFYKKLMEVSTPDHPKYGKHYSGHELRSLLKPKEEASRIAISWLQDNNVTKIRDDGEYILFQTNVETANEMLDTKFNWYRDLDGHTILRTKKYSVPESVKEHINFIQPTTRFGSLKPLSSYSKIMPDAENAVLANGAAAPASCNRTITPACLLDLYNVKYKAPNNTGNTVGFASFLEEYARYSDLVLFEQTYAKNAVGTNLSVVLFNGGLNDQKSTNDSGEANLDAQYVLAVGYPVPVTEFSTGGRGLLIPDGDSPTQNDNTNEPYLDFLLALTKLDNKDIPNSISISYGENEQEIPNSYAEQVCNLFAQLGARGKTILFSSGDSGVGDSCLSNDGKNTTKFQPQFPASCPYVTSVGGTKNIEPEVGVYFSSGGFSNLWARPSYQDEAVTGYLTKLGKQNAGYFNTSGRAFPDVAAQGVNYRVFDSGVDAGYQGTSCSAPTFNGIVALLNSARLANNQSTLGFLNPWIYSTGKSGFNDVTLGAGTGCNGYSRFNGGQNGSPVIPGAAWNATVGWDAVTGLGTPDFGKLLALSSPGVKNS